jgi:hypothetical protein
MPWITAKSATVQLHARAAREVISYPTIITLACSAKYNPAKCVMDLEKAVMSVKVVTMLMLITVLCVQTN